MFSWTDRLWTINANNNNNNNYNNCIQIYSSNVSESTAGTSTHLLSKIHKHRRRTVLEVWLEPALRFIAHSRRHSLHILRAQLLCHWPKQCSLPPDLCTKCPWTGVVDDLTAAQRHFGKLAPTGIALTSNHIATTRALSRCKVTCAAVRTNIVTVTRIAGVTHAIMVCLKNKDIVNITVWTTEHSYWGGLALRSIHPSIARWVQHP